MKTWLQMACELGVLLEAETNDGHPKAPKDALGQMQLENEVQSALAELRLMIRKNKAYESRSDAWREEARKLFNCLVQCDDKDWQAMRKRTLEDFQAFRQTGARKETVDRPATQP